MLTELIDKHKLPKQAWLPIVNENLVWHPLIYVTGGLAELERNGKNTISKNW